MKKLLLLFLLTLLLSACGTDLPVAAAKRKTVPLSAPAAKLSLFSYDGKNECSYLIQSYGHTFLMLENCSDSEIDLNGYLLSPGDSVTFGWWAVDAHLGMWFNLEANYIHLKNRYDTRVSVTADLTEDGLARLKSYLSENDFYSPWDNCAKKAIGGWNAAVEADATIDAGSLVTPREICRELAQFEQMQFAAQVPPGDAFRMIDGKAVFYRMEDAA